MEIRQFAERVLLSPDLTIKLSAIEQPVTDEQIQRIKTNAGKKRL